MAEELKAEDLRIDTYYAGEHSGFLHTNQTAVRITHLPTGVFVESKDERSVHANKQRCLDLLPEAIASMNTRTQLPSQGGEAVEVVGYGCTGQIEVLKHVPLTGGMKVSGREREKYNVPLMTVAQHQRILAASVGSAEPVAWREHSVNYAKGEKCPETIETLQAAWDRDQELINDMRQEIARHKTRINRLEQRRPADQVAEPDAELVRQCIAQELATWEGDFKGPVHTAMRCLQVRIDAKMATLK